MRMRPGAGPGFLFDARGRESFPSTGTVASDTALSLRRQRAKTMCYSQERSQLPTLCKWISHIPQWSLGAVHPKLNCKTWFWFRNRKAGLGSRSGRENFAGDTQNKPANQMRHTGKRTNFTKDSQETRLGRIIHSK